MPGYKVCVVGGWCGNRMVMVAEHLQQALEQRGYPSRVIHHSVWDNFAAPPPSNLVLQLLPAFTEKDTGCPVINIKPMIVDLDDAPTLEKIFTRVAEDYPR